MVCPRYCPSRVEAEDALQNTFVKIFTHLGQYHGEGPFEAWSRRVAVHTALHAVEQYRLRHPADASTSDLNDHASLPSLEPTALDTLAAEDLLHHLAALPIGYRTLLSVRRWSGLAAQVQVRRVLSGRWAWATTNTLRACACNWPALPCIYSSAIPTGF